MRVTGVAWNVGNNFPLKSFVYSQVYVLKGVVVEITLCLLMTNFAKVLVWNCSMRREPWRWVRFRSLVIRRFMGPSLLANSWFLRLFAGLRSGMTAHPLHPMFQRLAHPGKCQRPPGSIYPAIFQDQWDGIGLRALGRCSKLITWSLNLDSCLSKIHAPPRASPI